MQLAIDSALYAHVHPVLLGYARRAVRHEEVAADLVQDTWVAGTRHFAAFDGRSSLRSWLVGILKHKIVDHFRKAGREIALSGLGEPLVHSRADDQLDARHALQVVSAALNDLPVLQRRAIELCDLRGWSRTRAAGELGIERGHLRVLLHRARHRLRLELEPAGW